MRLIWIGLSALLLASFLAGSMFAQDAAPAAPASGPQGPEKKHIALMGTTTIIEEAKSITPRVNQVTMSFFQTMQRFIIDDLQSKPIDNMEAFIEGVQGKRADKAFSQGTMVLESAEVDQVLNAFLVIVPVIVNYTEQKIKRQATKKTTSLPYAPNLAHLENTKVEWVDSDTADITYTYSTDENQSLASTGMRTYQSDQKMGSRAAKKDEPAATPAAETPAATEPAATEPAATTTQPASEEGGPFTYQVNMRVDLKIYNMETKAYEPLISTMTEGDSDASMANAINELLTGTEDGNGQGGFQSDLEASIRQSETFKVKTKIQSLQGSKIIIEGGKDFDFFKGMELKALSGENEVGYLRVSNARATSSEAKRLWGSFAADAQLVENYLRGFHIKFRLGLAMFNMPEKDGYATLLDEIKKESQTKIDEVIATGTNTSLINVLNNFNTSSAASLADPAKVGVRPAIAFSLQGEYEIGWGGRFILGGEVGFDTAFDPGATITFAGELGLGYNLYLGRLQLQPRILGGIYGFSGDILNLQSADEADELTVSLTGITGGLHPNLLITLQLGPQGFFDIDAGFRLGFPSTSYSYSFSDGDLADGSVSGVADDGGFDFLGLHLMIGGGFKF